MERPGFLWFAWGIAVIAAVPRQAHASEVVLHNFACPPKGAYPSELMLDSAGNLYGTTSKGGAANYGVVYEVDDTGNQTVLYSFTGFADGGAPTVGVIEDSAGNLYGTATEGGGRGTLYCRPYACAVVYQLDPTGHETVLYSFTGGSDGGIPQTGVVGDSAGNLYGTTYYGGERYTGVVFEITP
jgi:uncharacterized repeat protein (TIGR03803 family)